VAAAVVKPMVVVVVHIQKSQILPSLPDQ